MLNCMELFAFLAPLICSLMLSMLAFTEEYLMCNESQTVGLCFGYYLEMTLPKIEFKSL